MASRTSTMQAVRLHEPGGVGALQYEKIETPPLRSGQALVRVHAAAITRDELEWPADRLPATPSYEFSGVVAALEADADAVSVGDSVYALAGFDNDGAAAEYVAVDAAILARKPASLNHVQSAALPLAALSAWQGLFDHGRLESSDRVLITGAAGGVGHLATQLALWRGAHVIGTASSSKLDALQGLGVDEAIDYTTPVIDELAPVDLVFDTAGGELLSRVAAVVRHGGRLVSIAEEPPPGGSIATTYFVVEPRSDQLEELSRLVDNSELKPAIDSTFPLSEARAAFERSMARDTRGKVVLQVVHG
jgi:NADPH:quinone reductase-like Zn-dependent oxidoreductase